jgi:hypothetical protein
MYVTAQDIKQSFEKDSATLVIKDYKSMKLYFETASEDSSQVSDRPSVYVNGHLIRPIQIKLLSSLKLESEQLDNESQTMLNDLVKEVDTSSHLSLNQTTFNSKAILKQPNQLTLFNRARKQKNLLDLDRSELELLSENVLKLDKYQGKSKFQFVKDNNLVLPEDCVNPALIPVIPIGDDYADNYSAESPSVHDLYDLEAAPALENEEDEYIIEQLDEDMMDI